jgi:hypothetical protein
METVNVILFIGLNALRNSVEDQKTKADALVAELQNNPIVSAEVKTTITALASFLSSLTGSFSSL